MLYLTSSMTKTKEELEKEVEQLKTVVHTLVEWISQSMLSPITPQDAKTLLEMLDDKG